MAQLQVQNASKTLRGTWSEVQAQCNDMADSTPVELHVFEPTRTIQPETDASTIGASAAAPRKRVSAMGKYAGMLSSEEFMSRKQDDINREDSRSS